MWLRLSIPASQTCVPTGNLAASPWRLTSCSLENMAWPQGTGLCCELDSEVQAARPASSGSTTVGVSSAVLSTVLPSPQGGLPWPLVAGSTHQLHGRMSDALVKHTGAERPLRTTGRPGVGCVSLFLTSKETQAPLGPLRLFPASSTFQSSGDLASRPHSSLQIFSLS